MESILKIRVRRRQGESIRKISRDLRLSRNTVRKFIKMDKVEVPEYKRKTPHYPQTGAYLEKLKELVQENLQLSRPRQKKALYEELRDAGCTANYSTVCRQIRRLESLEREEPSAKAYVPLTFGYGEARNGV